MTEYVTGRFRRAVDHGAIAREVCRRFVDAGQADAIETLLEVFEMEAQDRRERRVERLRRASCLPPACTARQL